MRALILAALVAASTAMAEEAVYRSGDTTVRLSQEECRHPALIDALKAAGAEKPRTVTVTIRGWQIPGCWGVFGDKALIADVMGHSGFVLLRDFVPQPGV